MTSIKSCHIPFHTVYKCTKRNFSQLCSHSSAFKYFPPIMAKPSCFWKKNDELLSLPKALSLIGWPNVAACFLFICARLNWGPSVFNQFSGFYAFFFWSDNETFNIAKRGSNDWKATALGSEKQPLQYWCRGRKAFGFYLCYHRHRHCHHHHHPMFQFSDLF